MSLLTAVLLAAALTGGQDPDAPIVTGGSVRAAETAEALRVREALAYATPLPRGAPEADYPLVAWCEALVTGHVAVGESLTNVDPLDDEIVRLGKLEAADFRDALNVARARQTPATLAAAEAAAAGARAQWAEVLATEDEAVRSQTFGLFFGLPGRCEHAARRVRENITTPPATLDDAGLDETGAPAGER
jgi:hypothetical protein